MPWIPTKHSDEENLRWCWLRAVEWGRWPVFLSQVFGPFALLWADWKIVVGAVLITNMMWAVAVRYRFVSLNLAYWGVMFVTLRWLIWPASTTYLFWNHVQPEAWVAAAWPILLLPIGMFTPTQIDRIQNSFMAALGYTRRTASETAEGLSKS